MFPTIGEKCVGSLMSSANQYREDTEHEASGYSSLSQKIRMSKHLSMS